MKKTLSILLLLFLSGLLILGLATWFRHQADSVPRPLQPALAWVNAVQDDAARSWKDWFGLRGAATDELAARSRDTGNTKNASKENLIEQVTLGRSDVATVQINKDGSTEITGASMLSDNNMAIGQTAEQTSVDETDADAVIRQTDAAIARADAELARVLAGGRSDSAAVGVTSAEDRALSIGAGAEAIASMPAAGSVLAGATAALAGAPSGGPGRMGNLPASMPASVTAGLSDGVIVPPDAPDPALPVSAGGLEQQDTIRHFLSGETVEFELGRTALTERGERALLALLDIIRRHKETIITIQGHTDSVGDDASNLALSTARAAVARAFLIKRGIDPDRLRIQGFGERRPIAANSTVAGRIENRRIDFAVSDR